MLDRPLLIVTGKGGVGRSAVASAVARVHAAAGERVLAIAIDRGAGLTAHLGATTLDHEPRQVAPNLCAAVIDPSSALDEYVRLRIAAPVALAARVFRILALTVPGVRDIVLIGKVWYEATHGEWDRVVVDAAPAGQIQSILQAPQTIADLVPRGAVHDQAMEMASTIGDARTTGLVVVSTPEDMALTEAAEVTTAADEAGVSPARALVLNRVLEPASFTAPPDEPGDRRDAACLQLDVEESQARLLESVDADVMLPLILGSHSPTDVSNRLAARLR